YHPPTITAPMTRPPTMSSGVVRKSRLLNTNAAIAAATTSGSHQCTLAGTPHAFNSAGRSDALSPKWMRTGSRPYARTPANTPFSVMYAAAASTTSTISDFRLPAPSRMSVLLPQPDASVMPAPNSSPPTTFDSHGTSALV